MSKVTVNDKELIDQSNACFVQGTLRGSRKVIALRLCRIFNFEGGYRAAYRAVKHGYSSCDLYAGRIEGGGYGLNCWA